MSGKFRYAVGVVIVVVLITGTQSLLWGKLFPYSPIILGFSMKTYPNIVIYREDGLEDRDFAWLDRSIPSIEMFHDLKFTDKPRIFLFKSRETYAARSVSKARFCAFFNGDIVVSPWAIEEDRDGKISLRVYLTHELSHSLLYQNMDWLSVPSYPGWLLEGIATYSANQRGTSFYPSKAETLKLIRSGNWMPPFAFDTDEEDQVELNMPYPQAFTYSQFACVVEDLIVRFGKDRFIGYMKALLSSTDHDAVFMDAFGVTFADYIAAFRKEAERSKEEPDRAGEN